MISKGASGAAVWRSAVSVTVSIGVAERVEQRTPEECSSPPTRRCTAPRAPA